MNFVGNALAAPGANPGVAGLPGVAGVAGFPGFPGVAGIAGNPPAHPHYVVNAPAPVINILDEEEDVEELTKAQKAADRKRRLHAAEKALSPERKAEFIAIRNHKIKTEAAIADLYSFLKICSNFIVDEEAGNGPDMSFDIDTFVMREMLLQHPNVPIDQMGKERELKIMCTEGEQEIGVEKKFSVSAFSYFSRMRTGVNKASLNPTARYNAIREIPTSDDLSIFMASSKLFKSADQSEKPSKKPKKKPKKPSMKKKRKASSSSSSSSSSSVKKPKALKKQKLVKKPKVLKGKQLASEILKTAKEMADSSEIEYNQVQLSYFKLAVQALELGMTL